VRLHLVYLRTVEAEFARLEVKIFHPQAYNLATAQPMIEQQTYEQCITADLWRVRSPNLQRSADSGGNGDGSRLFASFARGNACGHTLGVHLLGFAVTVALHIANQGVLVGGWAARLKRQRCVDLDRREPTIDRRGSITLLQERGHKASNNTPRHPVPCCRVGLKGVRTGLYVNRGEILGKGGQVMPVAAQGVDRLAPGVLSEDVAGPMVIGYYAHQCAGVIVRGFKGL
jgi:hypothetical protein